jgi:hypothetical protein
MRHVALFTFVVASLALPVATYAGQARGAGAARFEVTSLRAVRPILVKTIADLEKKDAAAAKTDMDNYDSAWNGVEVYVSTRSMDLYNEIEHHYQTAVTDALNKPNPDTAAILADARAMLAKYDEMLALVEKSAPLNRLYDDVAKLRIERSRLREVTPALKAGNLAKARKSFEAFDDNWDNIEDLVKERSRESYDAIEKGMVTIERQLMPAKPDIDATIATVGEVMTEYNKIVNQIAREARDAK